MAHPALRLGHASAVRALAHSPDQSRLASADDLGGVLLHGEEGPRCLRAPRAPPVRPWHPDTRPSVRVVAGVVDLAFVAGGALLAVLDDPGGLTLFDLETGEVRLRLPRVTGPIAADGTELWAWLGAELVRLDLRTGGRTFARRIPCADPRPRPDVRNRRLGQVARGVLRVWDLDGACVLEQVVGDDQGSPPALVVFAPDGARAAWVDRDLRVLTLADGRVTRFPIGEIFSIIRWFPEGVYVAGEHLYRCPVPEGAVAVLPVRVGTEWTTGATTEAPLVVGDREGRILQVGPPRWPPCRARGHTALVSVRRLVVTAGCVVAAYDDGVVRAWSLVDGRVRAVRPPFGEVVAIDGEWILTRTHDAVFAWDMAGRTAWRVEARRDGGPEPWALGGHTVGGPRATPQPRAFGLVARSDRVRAVSVEGGEVADLGPANALAVAPDGRVALGAESTIRVAGAEGPLDAGCHVYSLAFSPDGRRLVSTGEEACVTSWRLEPPMGGQRLRVHADGVRAAVTNDGAVGAASPYDPRIFLFDPDFGRCRALVGHRGYGQEVAFSPRGHLLASGGTDGAVILWDRSGRRRMTFQVLGHGDRWVTHTPGGACVGEGADIEADPGRVAAALRRLRG